MPGGANILIPSFTKVCPGLPLNRHRGCLPTSIHFPGSQGLSPVQFVVHTWVCHSDDAGGGRGGAVGESLESMGTSPNTCYCLLCHPDLMTSYKEGREQKELFSSRYLRRLLTLLFSLA